MLDERLAVLYGNVFQVCLIFMLFVTFMVGKCGLKKKVINCHFLAKRTWKIATKKVLNRWVESGILLART